jgi:transposase-like protein
LTRGYRFPPEIISHGVWLYYRFAVSLRDVSELPLAGALKSRTKPSASGRCGSVWSTPDG